MISCHLFICIRECLCSMHTCRYVGGRVLHRGQRRSSGVFYHSPPYSYSSSYYYYHFKAGSFARIGACFILARITAHKPQESSSLWFPWCLGYRHSHEHIEFVWWVLGSTPQSSYLYRKHS